MMIMNTTKPIFWHIIQWLGRFIMICTNSNFRSWFILDLDIPSWSQTRISTANANGHALRRLCRWCCWDEDSALLCFWWHCRSSWTYGIIWGADENTGIYILFDCVHTIPNTNMLCIIRLDRIPALTYLLVFRCHWHPKTFSRSLEVSITKREMSQLKNCLQMLRHTGY